MAWLLRKGEVLASLEVAATPAERVRQMAGRPAESGALLLRNTRSAHSLRSSGGLDVAWLGEDLVVLSTASLHPNRIGLPRKRARHLLEAPAGAFERWHLRPGDALEVEE